VPGPRALSAPRPGRRPPRLAYSQSGERGAAPLWADDLVTARYRDVPSSGYGRWAAAATRLPATLRSGRRRTHPPPPHLAIHPPTHTPWSGTHCAVLVDKDASPRRARPRRSDPLQAVPSPWDLPPPPPVGPPPAPYGEPLGPSHLAPVAPPPPPLTYAPEAWPPSGPFGTGVEAYAGGLYGRTGGPHAYAVYPSQPPPYGALPLAPPPWVSSKEVRRRWVVRRLRGRCSCMGARRGAQREPSR
jgi:hypothetical protein